MNFFNIFRFKIVIIKFYFGLIGFYFFRFKYCFRTKQILWNTFLKSYH